MEKSPVTNQESRANPMAYLSITPVANEQKYKYTHMRRKWCWYMQTQKWLGDELFGYMLVCIFKHHGAFGYRNDMRNDMLMWLNYS